MDIESLITQCMQSRLPIDESNEVSQDETEKCEKQRIVARTEHSEITDDVFKQEDTQQDLRDRSMHVILPPTSFVSSDNVNIRSTSMIYTLKVLDEFVSLSSTRQIFDEILTPNITTLKKKPTTSRGSRYQPKKKKAKIHHHQISRPDILDNINAIKSIRFIQAGRYEIFVQARGQETHVFDWLCDQVYDSCCMGSNLPYETSLEMKYDILQFAIEQAKRDDRINSSKTSNSTVLYDNFSLIVNYDPVAAQPQHIDLLYPNHQFGLIITDKSPGTTLYRAPHNIRTVKDIQTYVWKDLPSSMCTIIEKDEAVSSLIAQFGDVLCPNIVPIPYFESNDKSNGDVLFRTGTLLSLPGSEIHAGPRCDTYRTVLFFSACPDVVNTIPYHPDTQYFAPLLCCDVIYLLWEDMSLTDRMYMLNRLLDSINEAKCEHLEHHISDKNLIYFLKVAMNWETNKPKSNCYLKKYGRNSTVNDFVHYFASKGVSNDESNYNDIQFSNIATRHKSTHLQPLGSIQNAVRNAFDQNMGTALSTESPHDPDIVRTNDSTGNNCASNLLNNSYCPTYSMSEDVIRKKDHFIDGYEDDFNGTLTIGTNILRDTDVLSGTGNHLYSGNRTFMDLVKRSSFSFTSALSKEKNAICDSIVRTIQATNGRFLCKHTKSDSWFEIGNDAAKLRTFTSLNNYCRTHMKDIMHATRKRKKRVLFTNADSETSVCDYQTFSKTKNAWNGSAERYGTVQHVANVILDEGYLQDTNKSAYVEDIKDLNVFNGSRNTCDLTYINDERYEIEKCDPGFTSRSTQRTLIVGDTDVLSGRGSNHAYGGNRHFLDLVRLYSQSYSKATRRDKTKICNLIISSVREVKGRFICKDSVSGLWYDIGNDAAQKRTHEAFRNLEHQARRKVDSNDAVTNQTQQSKTTTLHHHCEKSSMNDLYESLGHGTKILRETDVLCGRGFHHTYCGNRSFLNLVKLFQCSFDKATHEDKDRICGSIVRSVRDANGRFLLLNKESGLWFDIGDYAAHQKTYTSLLNQINYNKNRETLMSTTERSSSRKI